MKVYATEIAASLRAAISRGEYLPGSRVPSALVLSSAHGADLATARRALLILAAEGLVAAVPGVGTYHVADDVDKRLLMPLGA